jgi:hypothetical protein
VSPILVRPVREQLEHDRIIRLLQAKYQRRKFNAGANPGSEQTSPTAPGPEGLYPDLVLVPVSGRGHKLAGVVEVETGESVNALEAMAQWVPLGRLPVEFALYVPAHSIEVARRLCADKGVGVTELWTYHMVGDQLRFTLVDRTALDAKLAAARARAAAARPHARKSAPKKAAAARRPAPRSVAAKAPAKARPKPAKARTASARKPARKTR